jgi:HEPN domain-containing protein
MKTKTDLVVNQWVEKAEHDLYAANLLLHDDSTDDTPMDIICFHAQQCAEKYIKSRIAEQKKIIPRTHDLIELISELPDNLRNTIPIEDLAELNPFSVEIRYPGIAEEITRDDAARAVDIAIKIKKCLER